MNITIRYLIFGIAAILDGAVMAQMPYTVTLNGVVPGCYVGQTVNVQTIQGTEPAYNIDVPVEPNSCTWSVTLGLVSNYVWYTLTTACNGTLVPAGNFILFNEPTDSVSQFVMLSCAGDPDCGGVFGGSALPGTICGDAGQEGLYSTSCICVTDSLNPIDCLNIAGGSAQPGADCTTALGIPGTWSINCNCEANSSICQACFTSTAANIPNGNDPIPFMANFNNCSLSSLTPPYTYSWSFDGGLTYTSSDVSPQYTFGVGTTLVCLQFSASDGCISTICDSVVFDAFGTLNPSGNSGCSAGYWLIQAYQNVDTTGGNPGGVEPIPNEVWIWNTSTGSGNYQFFWDFGDGATSTEAFPTHIYANGGPYILCLTVTDDANCTSTFCDTLSIDADGLLEGMIVDGNNHGNSNASDRAGFTLNVISELPTTINEQGSLNEVALWPNPVSDAITLTLLSSRNSKLELSIMDLNGRLISITNNAINAGNNGVTLQVSELESGIYIIRISDGTTTVSRRFVKH